MALTSVIVVAAHAVRVARLEHAQLVVGRLLAVRRSNRDLPDERPDGDAAELELRGVLELLQHRLPVAGADAGVEPPDVLGEQAAQPQTLFLP